MSKLHIFSGGQVCPFWMNESSQEKYIVSHALRLYKRNRIQLLNYCIKLKIPVSETGSGCLINLGRCTAFQIDSLYNRLLKIEQHELEECTASGNLMSWRS